MNNEQVKGITISCPEVAQTQVVEEPLATTTQKESKSEDTISEGEQPTKDDIIRRAFTWNRTPKEKANRENDIKKRNILFNENARKICGLCLYHGSNENLSICLKKANYECINPKHKI